MVQNDETLAITEGAHEVPFDEPSREADLHTRRGLALAAESRTADASLAFAEAVRLSPSAPSYRNLGVALMSLGDHKGADAAFRHAIAADANYLDAYELLAAALDAAGAFAESALILQQAVFRQPIASMSLRCKLAAAHLRAGQWDDVERQLDPLLDAHPNEVAGHALLAVLRDRQRRHAEADAHFALGLCLHRSKPRRWPTDFPRELARLMCRYEAATCAPHRRADLICPDTDTQPPLTILIGCYGSFPQYSVRCLDSVLSGVAGRCEIWVGLNAVCERTATEVERARAAGKISGVIRSNRNLNKDPMMRLLLEQVRTPYLLWLDDDSHFTSPGWLDALEAFIHANHPFDVAGQLARWGPRRHLDRTYMQFIRQRPWWTSDAHLPPDLREWCPFVVGGMFLARTNFLRTHDFPDRGMVKAMDDVALGELILQQGGLQIGLPQDVLDLVRISDGDRRGENFELPAAYP